MLTVRPDQLTNLVQARATVATLEPVVATVIAWLWLGETLGAMQLVGGAIVLAGIFLAQSAR